MNADLDLFSFCSMMWGKFIFIVFMLKEDQKLQIDPYCEFTIDLHQNWGQMMSVCFKQSAPTDF